MNKFNDRKSIVDKLVIVTTKDILHIFYNRSIVNMSMDIEKGGDDDSQRQSFPKMLNDFINVDINKSNMGKHKNLERSIEIFTKTKECWGESIKVLITQQDPNVLTLCSSILKNKLQFDFSQLTAQTFQELHSSILHIISKLSKPTSALRNNLSVCIAFIYIHSFEHIGELLPYLSKCFSNVENRNYIYNVLEVLPQEIDNSTLVVEEDKRILIRKYLKTIQKQVLVELNNVAALTWGTNEIKQRTLFKCFSNWIDLQVDNEILESLPEHFLLQQAFECLENRDVSDQCILVLKHTIRSIDTPKQSPKLYKYLAERIISFFALIKAKMDEEIFACEDYVYILSTFARASREEFVSTLSEDYLRFIANMIEITNEPEFTSIALITFWQKFLISVVKRKQAIEFYRPQLKILFTTFSKLVKFTVLECQQANERSTSSLEKINANFANKMDNRNEVQDIFKLLAECLGNKECLELALNSIDSLDANNKNFWPLLECYLNPLETVIDEYSELSATLDQLVGKLLEVSSPYVIVQKTFIRILSNCSILYSKNPDMSLRIFNYLVNNLNNPEMLNTVSKAFENVCTNNVQFVLANIDSFVEIIKKYSDNDRILKGVMIALSTDSNKLNASFPKIFQELLQKLSVQTQIKETKLVLDRMIIMFKQISNDDPRPYSLIVSQCFDSLWGYLKLVLEKECKSRDEESLLEKCAKLIKYVLRCLKQFFQPFMDNLYFTILNAYAKYPLGSYVYLVQVLVTIFSEASEFLGPITVLFEKICEITFVHLSKLNDIQSNQSLSEDFFGMLSRFMRFIPQIINNFSHFQNLLQLANIGCGIKNGTLARVFYSFIEDMYMQFWDIELVKSYVKNENPIDKLITERSQEMYQSRQKIRGLVLNSTYGLVTKMIKHLEDSPSTSVRHCIIDTLLSEVKAFPNQNKELWLNILQGIAPKILTNFEKNKFIELISTPTESSFEDIEELITLMSKRYIHEAVRSPIN